MVDLASFDPLTELPLLASGTAAARLRAPLLACVGLDGLGTVNAAYGRPAGDTVLRRVADRLRALAEGWVVRLGGDEFAFELEAAEDHGVLAGVLAALTAPVAVGGDEVPVSASMGVAVPEPDEAIGTALRRAESAMAEAKRRGGGRVVLARPDDGGLAGDPSRVLAGLRTAVAREELVLHFQPILDLRTGTATTLEALLRWQHPQEGLVQPGAFLPIAESAGLMPALGTWVLHDACRACASWRAAPGAERVCVNVNVAADQLADPGFVGEVALALADAALDADGLVLEITETGLMRDVEQALRTLRRIRAMGVRLAIDDFGTGYSSLGYIRRLPVQHLKVDRTFVTEMHRNRTQVEVVRAVIRLADALALTVTAEGIEVVEELDELTILGCQRGQGYLFSRPVGLDAVARLLRSPLLLPR